MPMSTSEGVWGPVLVQSDLFLSATISGEELYVHNLRANSILHGQDGAAAREGKGLPGAPGAKTRRGRHCRHLRAHACARVGNIDALLLQTLLPATFSVLLVSARFPSE